MLRYIVFITSDVGGSGWDCVLRERAREANKGPVFSFNTVEQALAAAGQRISIIVEGFNAGRSERDLKPLTLTEVEKLCIGEDMKVQVIDLVTGELAKVVNAKDCAHLGPMVAVAA